MLSQYDTVIHSHGSNAEYVPLAVLTWTFLKMTPTEYGPFLIEIEWFLWCNKSNTFRQPSDQHPVNLKGLHLRNGLGMGQGAKGRRRTGSGICATYVARSEPSKNPTKGGKYHPQVDTMALCRHKNPQMFDDV